MNIPFYNLQRENGVIENDLISSVSTVIKSGQYILGNNLSLFEENFAEYIGTKFCCGVGNGLDALVLALRALDIKSGDEVIVPANTFIATWLAVSQVGAKIIPIEPDNTFNISPVAITKAITKNTKAIIPVHLYGRPANMFEVSKIAKQFSLYVIEDAAQAQGASINDVKCGNLSDVAAFSFYPVKNLGACGDAGAITTNNKEIAEKIKSLRNYGSTEKYNHQELGVNSRLDRIQAAFLDVKLAHLDDVNEKKAQIAKRYLSEIVNPKISLPLIAFDNTFIAWHQFVIRIKNREPFISYMSKQGIATLIHYPIPPHLSGAYKKHFKPNAYPLTVLISNEIISIPIYSTLSDDEVSFIIKMINEYE